MVAMIQNLTRTDVNPDGPQMQMELQWVTKHQAAYWLENLNRGNRTISKHITKVWTDRFNSGRYVPTHQGIAFDEEGNLSDGQHRLAGLVCSDVDGFWVWVATDVPREAFAVMDRGRMRNAAQLITAPYASIKGGAARVMVDYPDMLLRNSAVELADVMAAYEAHKEAIDAVAPLALRVYHGMRLAPGVHAGLLALVVTSNGDPVDKIEGWVEGLTTGAGLEEGDPRLALRNRWSVEGRSLNNQSSSQGRFFLIRAWNAWVNGERLNRMQLPRGGGAITNAVLPKVAR